MDPRHGAILWVARQFRLPQIDAELIVDTAWDHALARYGDRHDDEEFERLFNAAVRNEANTFLRTREKKRRVKLPPPGAPVDRFQEFVLELGRKSRKELVLWHKGTTPEESAALRGITVESVKRERRRIIGRWKRYLQACPDLSEAEKRDLSPYLYGAPRLADIR